MEDAKRLRVLVADDDARLREAIVAILGEAGFEVLEASDGNVALRMCREHSVDVIVCDLFMPGKDGLETIRQLRRERPDARIIAMSGGAYKGALDMLPAARMMGAAAILSKPFSIATLLAEIERLRKE